MNKKILVINGEDFDNKISQDKKKIVIDSINSVLNDEYEVLVVDDISKIDEHNNRIYDMFYPITPTPMFEDPIVKNDNEQPWYTKFDKKRKCHRK